MVLSAAARAFAAKLRLENQALPPRAELAKEVVDIGQYVDVVYVFFLTAFVTVLMPHVRARTFCERLESMS